jgi:hypothetical protein
MFPDFSIVTTGKISDMSSKHWMTSGISWGGEYLTQSISEHPSDVVESSLSQVIKSTAPPESFLKEDHLKKWLERAKYRTALLPNNLESAFRTQICLLSNMRRLEENQKRGRKRKDTETTEKPSHLTHVEAQTLYVRRMLASEYEVLQGFPENWTLVEPEP